jgi:hypothetical protein
MFGKFLPVVAFALSAGTAQAQSAQGFGSEALARAAIESQGYRDVKHLTRDPVGNWSGEAVRDSLAIAVILQTNGEIAEE